MKLQDSMSPAFFWGSKFSLTDKVRAFDVPGMYSLRADEMQ